MGRKSHILNAILGTALGGGMEAIKLIEAGFDYVTGEYNDGGKLFRKRK